MILGAMSLGATLAKAGKLVGVTRQAVAKHATKHPAFQERMDEARSIADANVIRSLYRAARSGNVTAMIFWLKNRIPSEWRDRREIVAQVRTDEVREIQYASGQVITPAAAGLPEASS